MNRRASLEMLAYFVTALLLGIILGGFMPLDASDKVPDHPETAHMYGDGVLFPRLMAALFDFQFRHPVDRQNAFDHVATVDAKFPDDRARFRSACEAFDRWKDAMKKAGY